MVTVCSSSEPESRLTRCYKGTTGTQRHGHSEKGLAAAERSLPASKQKLELSLYNAGVPQKVFMARGGDLRTEAEVRVGQEPNIT